MEALLNPEKEWVDIPGGGGPGRRVRSAVAFDGSKVAIKTLRIVDRQKVQINYLLTASIR
jgi:hypothetical protein